MESLLDQVKFDEKGLVTAIVQDAQTREVLMLAWMNRESLSLTIQEKRAWYWSRSRRKLWLKGETSGHVQKIKEIRLDCDGDAILISVEQVGGACHTGHQSCFYRSEQDGQWQETADKVFSPDEVYHR